jgi:SAM-dependent methyltransferase
MQPDVHPRADGDFELRDEFGNTEANLHFLSAIARLPLTARILEIGSGRGALLRHLLEQGHSVVGVEINADRIEESRRLYGPLPITKVDGTRLPFPDASFDILLSFDVFEHIPDSDAHLEEVRRVLAPEGRYLLQTPNKWTNTVFETIRWRSFTSWRADHCALHTFGQIRRRFERQGFSVEFADVPVVTDFFRRKIRHYLGAPAVALLKVANPDRLPLRLRTNFYVQATRQRT